VIFRFSQHRSGFKTLYQVQSLKVAKVPESDPKLEPHAKAQRFKGFSTV
jgi:hypothetical protein